MPRGARKMPEGKDRLAGLRASHWALLVFALAALLRFLPVLLWPTLGYVDEIFQAIEQGHRLVFGYGMVPWEFEYGARSWLLAYASAGLIRASLLIGDSPDIYLAVIGAAFSLLSAVSVACAFLWARRQFGIALGLLAALVPLCWVDCIFYGARTLAEPVAVSLLVPGLYLAFPGTPVRSRARLALAGALMAASVIFRLQLGPVVALAWVWGEREGWKRRVLWLSLGAAAVVALDGVFDALTWSFPFEPLWRNFAFNMLQHGSEAYGTRAWWWYVYDYAGAWGPALPVFLGLAMVGARRLPLPFLIGAGYCVILSLIPHKETRFLVPAITLFAICAGFGLVQLGLWLRDGMPDGRRRQGAIFAALGAAWLILSAIGIFGLDYEEYWNRNQRDAWLAAAQLYREPPACGLGIYGFDILRAGGYTHLHRRVPIYPVAPDITAAGLAQAAPDFDTAIADFNRLPREAPSLAALGYHREICFGGNCILRRPGKCSGKVMPKPEGPPDFDLGPRRYPQRQGVND